MYTKRHYSAILDTYNFSSVSFGRESCRALSSVLKKICMSSITTTYLLEKYICVHNISYLVHSVMLDAGKILIFTHVLLGFFKIQLISDYWRGVR